jgi:L-fuculose-phosphate aldolase
LRKIDRDERRSRALIVRVGRLLYQKGWVAATEGNLTVRLDEKRVLATPTGVSKGTLTAEQLIVTDLEGGRIAGRGEPTSEMSMHVAFYRARPEVRAVVHAHPPTATGFAAAGRALDQAVLPEVIVTLGSVPLAPYGQPGTPALAQSLKRYVKRYDAVLLANHGVVTCGEDLIAAFFRMEIVEQFARIALVAELLGGARTLPPGEIRKLIAARPRYGAAPRGGTS